MDLDRSLALLDALLTSASTCCMALGYAAIRRQRVGAHRRWMLAAFAMACAFVVSFVTRYVRFGRAAFAGRGVLRVAYLVVWFSHEPIAVVSVPLVLAAVVLGLRGAFDGHREVARMALPAWLYASVTGVALYALLYVWPAP